MISRRTCLRLAACITGLGTARGSVPRKSLTSINSIEIPFGPNPKLRQLRCFNNSLFALGAVRGPRPIIEIDSTGKVKSRSFVPAGTQRFTITPKGQLVALRYEKGTSYVYRDLLPDLVRSGP